MSNSGSGLIIKSIESKSTKVVFARFYEGEDLLEAVASTSQQHNVTSGFFFLIGTLKRAVLGYYKDGEYEPIEKAGPLEIVSCLGNISVTAEAELIVHGHIVVSGDDGAAFGGHILHGCLVDATAELVLVASENGILKRVYDAQKKLNLWAFNK